MEGSDPVGVKNLEDLWDKLSNSARISREEAVSEFIDRDDRNYFYGVYEGQMYALAILSSFLGRQEDYKNLCKSFNDVSLPFEDEYDTKSVGSR